MPTMIYAARDETMSRWRLEANATFVVVTEGGAKRLGRRVPDFIEAD